MELARRRWHGHEAEVGGGSSDRGRSRCFVCSGPALILLFVLANGVAAEVGKGPYPVVFTEAKLAKSMKTVGSSFDAAKASLAANDISVAKSQFVHTREELAVTITFWRQHDKSDAVEMLRRTLVGLDELDTALSTQSVDRAITDALSSRVEDGCRSCHNVYRQEDSSTKAYRIRQGSI